MKIQWISATVFASPSSPSPKPNIRPQGPQLETGGAKARQNRTFHPKDPNWKPEEQKSKTSKVPKNVPKSVESKTRVSVPGIEPGSARPQRGVLPLYYTDWMTTASHSHIMANTPQIMSGQSCYSGARVVNTNDEAEVGAKALPMNDFVFCHLRQPKPDKEKPLSYFIILTKRQMLHTTTENKKTHA